MYKRPSEKFTDRVRVKVFDGEQLVTEGLAVNKQAIELPMPENAKLWSPQSPFLYKTEVTLENNGKMVDKVNGYVAMRKYSTRRDKDGIVRLQLNNQDLFQFGCLLYTSYLDRYRYRSLYLFYFPGKLIFF